MFQSSQFTLIHEIFKVYNLRENLSFKTVVAVYLEVLDYQSID